MLQRAVPVTETTGKEENCSKCSSRFYPFFTEHPKMVQEMKQKSSLEKYNTHKTTPFPGASEELSQVNCSLYSLLGHSPPVYFLPP